MEEGWEGEEVEVFQGQVLQAEAVFQEGEFNALKDNTGPLLIDRPELSQEVREGLLLKGPKIINVHEMFKVRIGFREAQIEWPQAHKIE